MRPHFSDSFHTRCFRFSSLLSSSFLCVRFVSFFYLFGLFILVSIQNNWILSIFDNLHREISMHMIVMVPQKGPHTDNAYQKTNETHINANTQKDMNFNNFRIEIYKLLLRSFSLILIWPQKTIAFNWNAKMKIFLFV